MSGFFMDIEAFLAAALRQAAPLTLAGIGVAWAEKAGILNIGEEGIMLFGAFGGFICAYYSGNLAVGLLGGIIAGLCSALLYALLCIRYRADQTTTGLAMNFFAQGLTSFCFLQIFGQGSSLPNIDKISSVRIPLLADTPLIGRLFDQNILVYFLYFLMIGSALIFYRSDWGVNLAAVGEHPAAADSAGLNVFRIRYTACAINGVLGGLAGAFLSLAQLGYFQEGIVSGKGYMALVAVILGRRNPFLIWLAALMIGFAESLQFTLQARGIPLPSQVFSMLPYVVAILVLLLSIGKSGNPSALGIPYERDKR